MRNLKKFLALVLAMLMVVSAAATVSAFDDVVDGDDFYAAITDLVDKGIAQGMDEATFNPDGDVTRLQAAIFFARVITGETDPTNEIWNKGLSLFSDVTEFQYAVTTTVNAGIVNGMGDGTYNPAGNITFIQAIKMAVCALGYGDGLEWGTDGSAYYLVALDLGLTEGLETITEHTKPLTRGEFAQLIYNMLYTKQADGTASYAGKNFGIETADNVTTMAIVATEKQYATENINVAEKGFVGVQELVNGVPSGDVYYLPLADFGFEDDAAAEEYFLDAFNFVNWDGYDFTGINRVDGKDVVYNTEVTEASKGNTDLGKVTIDGKKYYMVEEFTGTAIRNEIVVYNRGENKYVHTDKVLAVTRNGEVYGIVDGKKALVLTAVYDKDGEILYFVEESTGKYLAEDVATAKYGVAVESAYETSLGIMEQKELVGAYQLTTYDDNGDGIIDRAYYTPVYVAAYGLDSNKKPTFGPMAGKSGVTFVSEEDLTKGDVITYTYNAQLNEVTVLDTYEVQYGTINRIRTLTDNSSNKYKVTVTIDGTEYILGNNYRDENSLQSFSIYANDNNKTVKAIANLTGKNNDGSNFNSGKASIGYTYENNFAPNTFNAKNYVGFVEIDGVIVLMETIADDNNYKIALFDDMVDYDFDAVYLDLWVNGEFMENVAVTRIQKTNGKYADIADLSIKERADVYQRYLTAETGDVFKYMVNDDGVTLSVTMNDDTCNGEHTHTDKCFASEIVENNKVVRSAADYNLAYAKPDGRDFVFENGVGDRKDAATDYVAIRTNSNTLFYFVNTKDNTITTFKGVPSDGWYIKSSATVFANNIGYSIGDGKGNTWASSYGQENTIANGIAGEASIVIVYFNDVTEIGGFTVSGLQTKLVYMTTAADNGYGYIGSDSNYFDPYDNYNGKELGLDRQYWDEEFYLYTTKCGIDMKTGAAVSKVFVNEDEILVPGKYYWMTNNNVIISQGMTAAEAGLTTTTLDFSKDVVYYGNRAYNVTGIGGKFDAVYMVLANAANDQVKSGDTAIDALTSAKKNVSYLVTSTGDKTILVGIIAKEDVTTPVTPAPVGKNATWGKNDGASFTGETMDANVAFTDAKSLNATIKLLGDHAFATNPTDVKIQINTIGAGDAEAALYPLSNNKVEFAVSADGVMTIKGVSKVDAPDVSRTLTDGTYKLILLWTEGSVTYRLEYSFTVPAAA